MPETIIILLIIFLSFAGFLLSVITYFRRKFRRNYLSDITEGIKRTKELPQSFLSESDLSQLPTLVRNYLVIVGVVDKPRVQNMRATFEAKMRSKTQDWFSLKAEQYSFFDINERFFFLDAYFKGLPTSGYHRYRDSQAAMKIKLLGMIPVVTVEGEMMFKAETVTFFNDMCFLAPATLIDKRIKWEEVDSCSVKATFTNLSTSISAILHFNDDGQLINFVSDDRYDVNEKNIYRFSTPLSQFKKIGGYNLPTYGEAIWHYPDGPFVYGRYRLKSIEYNIQ